MLAVVLCVLAGLGSAPAVDRDVERGAGLEPRDEASHDWHAIGGTALGEVGIGDNMTVDFELPKGHPVVSAGWEEEHVPVVVSHLEVGAEDTTRAGKRKQEVRSGRSCAMLSHGENGRQRWRGRDEEEEKDVRDGGFGHVMTSTKGEFGEMMDSEGDRTTIKCHGSRGSNPKEQQ